MHGTEDQREGNGAMKKLLRALLPVLLLALLLTTAARGASNISDGTACPKDPTGAGHDPRIANAAGRPDAHDPYRERRRNRSDPLFL